MADVDTALVQKIFDIPQQERKSHALHHRNANDLGVAVELLEPVFFVMRKGCETTLPSSTQFLLTKPRQGNRVACGAPVTQSWTKRAGDDQVSSGSI